jgi:S-adenosylmethionine hydrolase
MPFITLTTDMGLKDYYVSSIKGSIISQLPEATIIDITHEVKPWDILQASFIIKNAYSNFPAGTVHIVGVDTELGSDRNHIALKYDGHYFVGTDNGIFSLMLDRKPEKIVELNLAPEHGLTFPTKDIFVKAACHLARGGTLEILGKEIESIKQVNLGIPATEENTIVGKIIYVDNYENVICNINESTFKRISKGRPFSIYKGGTEYQVNTISKSYNDQDPGDIVVLFNEMGYLEIAINKGNACSLLNLKIGDQIRIYFDSK